MKIFEKTATGDRYRVADYFTAAMVAGIYGGAAEDYTDEGAFHQKEYLVVTTDAMDNADPVNGIPDISADGVAACLIKIQKKSTAGNDLTGASHTDDIMLVTDRGHLSALQVALVNGYAEITLTSVPETVVANITVTADGLDGDEISIQFAP